MLFVACMEGGRATALTHLRSVHHKKYQNTQAEWSTPTGRAGMGLVDTQLG